MPSLPGQQGRFEELAAARQDHGLLLQKGDSFRLEMLLKTHERRRTLESSSACQSLQTTNTDHLLLLHPSAIVIELLLRNHGGDKEV